MRGSGTCFFVQRFTGKRPSAPNAARKLHWHAAGPWVHTVEHRPGAVGERVDTRRPLLGYPATGPARGSTRCPDDPWHQPPGSPGAWTPGDLEALGWLIQNLAGWWG
jgi:nicotinamidase-related amidase